MEKAEQQRRGDKRPTYYSVVFKYVCDSGLDDGGTMMCESGHSTDYESDDDLCLVSECWVEPTYGITSSRSPLGHLDGLEFTQIPQVVTYSFFFADKSSLNHARGVSVGL